MLKRLVIAVIGAVGVLVVGLAVASATLWRADDVLVATVTSDRSYVVTAPGVIDLGGAPATVTARTTSGHPVVVVVGRDTDVLGWVGEDQYELVTGLSSWHTLATSAVTATASATASDTASPDGASSSDASSSDAATAADGAAQDTATPTPTASAAALVAVADPAGSDMWTASDEGTGSATLTWPSQAGRWSVLAASPDGTATTLSIAWPRTVTTPYLWPGVVGGGLLILLALVLTARLWWSGRRGDAGWTAVEVPPAPVAPAGVPRTRRELREAERLAAGPRPDGPRTGPVDRVAAPTSPRPAGRRRAAVPSEEPGAPAADPVDGARQPEQPAGRSLAAEAPAPAPEEPDPRGRRLLPRRRRAAAVTGAAAEPASTSSAPSAGDLSAGDLPTGADPAARPAPATGAGPATGAASDGGPGARPTWVPRRPSDVPGDLAGQPEAAPGATPPAAPGTARGYRPTAGPAPTPAGPAPTERPATPPRRTRPSWLSTDRGAPPPVAPAAEPEPVSPAPSTPSSPLLPPTVRADAWRRTWGIAPAEDESAQSAADEPEDGR